MPGWCDGALRHMPRARIQEAFQKGSCAQAAVDWTWSSGESLFLLARCTSGLGDPAVARSNLHEKPQLKWCAGHETRKWFLVQCWEIRSCFDLQTTIRFSIRNGTTARADCRCPGRTPASWARSTAILPRKSCFTLYVCCWWDIAFPEGIVLSLLLDDIVWKRHLDQTLIAGCSIWRLVLKVVSGFSCNNGNFDV